MRRPRATPLRLIPQIHRVTHQISLHIARLATLGVTQAEAHILDHLVSCGDCTVGELHRAFAHRRSTLTSVLDRLSGRALVTRDASPQDRRTFVVALTPAGTALASRVHAELHRVEAQVLASATARDVRSFENLLTAFERVLAPDAPAE